MDKKTTGYILVSFGILDFILSWVGMDITYWLIGDLSTFSPFIMGAIGYYLINSADNNIEMSCPHCNEAVSIPSDGTYDCPHCEKVFTYGNVKEPNLEDKGIEDQLKEYKSMFSKGLISDEDYEAKKKELLGL